MKTIYLKSFAQTGEFGKIKIGTLKKDVVNHLGSDFDFGDFGDTQIIKYGWYEFFFWSDSEKLFAIQNDHLKADCENHDEMILFKNNHFKIDTWFLKVNQNITYKQVIQLLNNEKIEYTKEPGSEFEPEIIRFKSGVYLDFSEGSFSWNSDKSEFYHSTIENKEDYVLNGIRLFDFNKN